MATPSSRAAAVLVAALAPLLLSAAGCGGDKEQQPADAGRTAPAARTRTTTPPGSDATTTGTREGPRTSGTSPEEQPGGAGDEEPARAPALFTGSGGRVSPRVVRVPPYIAVQVSLRSADGRGYSLRFPGRGALSTGGQRITVSTTFAGMRPGVSAVGRSSEGGTVTIVANAEPGP